MDVYSETLIDHYNHPHHTGFLQKPDGRAIRHNPLCGDTIQVDILLNHNSKIQDVAFRGSGCVLSQAGMSLLSDIMVGKSCTFVEKLGVDDMKALLGVTITPARLKCATLGLVTVKGALDKAKQKNKEIAKSKGKIKVGEKK